MHLIMRAVFQRVVSAYVEADGQRISQIGKGALVLVGAESGDTEKDASYIADKCVNLRVFEDEQGKMNVSIRDVSGSILLVSQFTLLGDCRKGRRPSFAHAAHPEKAEALIKTVADKIHSLGVPVQTGRFGAMMKVGLVNDGPVTLLLDSRRLF